MPKKYLNLEPGEVVRRTYKSDLFRGAFEGILSAGIQTFALFIAIRYFQAGQSVKSLIAAAPFIGMFLSLFLVHYAAGSRYSKSAWGAVPSFITGVCLILAGWSGSISWFALFVITGYVCRSALLPFLTSIYGDNYPPYSRAAYFSKPLILTVGFSAAFGFVGSSLLEWDLRYFSWLFTLLGLCGLGKGLAIYSMPSRLMEANDHKNPFSNLKYVFLDRSFGYVLFTWFLMGFANLWSLPLRVDYITSSEFGIEGSPLLVAFIITILPEVIRLIFTPFWARMFDRMNFIILRIILNLLFAAGVAGFFASNNVWIVGMGSALIGLAFSGGSIAWSLWVTKYAPPDKTAAYMSVHVCLTGVRGAIGPIVGYWTANRIGIFNFGWLSCAIMLFATALLIPEIKHGRRTSAPKL